MQLSSILPTIPAKMVVYVHYALALICIMFLFFPSPLSSVIPLYSWAVLLAFGCAISFYQLPSWSFLLVVITSLFAIHVTRRYNSYLKQPVGIYDLTQFTSTDGSGVLPASRTQSVFSPEPALNRADRKAYLESLKKAPRSEGGNDLEEVTLEETIVNEMTPLGKSFILPTGITPGIPGLYLGNNALNRGI